MRLLVGRFKINDMFGWYVIKADNGLGKINKYKFPG